jgi:putative ABC transport system permease protein
MNLFATLRLVLRTLLARKGRSALTILGIVIGVAGVIIIIALGAGAQALVLGQITKLGSNLLSVQAGKSNEKGPPVQLFGIVVTTLVNQDAEALRSPTAVPHATAVNANVRGTASLTWANRTVDTNFLATDSSYPEVQSFGMQAGQFFDKQQGEGGANVVVLGSTVADQLFGGTGVEPLGQIVKLKSSTQVTPGGVPLRVIGVVESRGTAFFQDLDDLLFVPLPIGQEQLLGIHYLQAINIKVDSTDNVTQTIDDVSRVLRQRHRIEPGSEDDFTVRNIADAVSILTTITDALSLFLTAMAAIALLVGGIGILNIMLATVAERTREVGLRKAVGASNQAIRNQFLFEAGTLTLLGGLAGIVIGVVVAYLVSVLMQFLGYDWAFVISPLSVVLAVGVSILTGVVFGLYPAFKAARLNPIDALRYE